MSQEIQIVILYSIYTVDMLVSSGQMYLILILARHVLLLGN